MIMSKSNKEILKELLKEMGLKDEFDHVINQPGTLFEDDQLIKLDLQSLRISFLPEHIWKLISLQELNLRDNQLTELPESIGLLTNLRILHLSGNQISELPESIGSLPNLQPLDISSNQFTILPESFFHLVSETDLKYTRIYASSNPWSKFEFKKLLATTADKPLIHETIRNFIKPYFSGELTALEEHIFGVDNREILDRQSFWLEITKNSGRILYSTLISIGLLIRFTRMNA